MYIKKTREVIYLEIKLIINRKLYEDNLIDEKTYNYTNSSLIKELESKKASLDNEDYSLINII